MNYRVKLIGDLDIAIRIKEYLKSDEYRGLFDSDIGIWWDALESKNRASITIDDDGIYYIHH